MKKLLLFLFLVGCTDSSTEIKIEKNETDSILIKSKETVFKTDSISKKVDQQIEDKVKDVKEDIADLKKENIALSKAALIKTEKIIRDTVYIETKKNFWGKTKTSTNVKSDSTETIDSLNN